MYFLFSTLYILPRSSLLLAPRSEIAKNLRNLPPDATVEECARARNAFTKDRIRQDFLDG